MVIFRKPEFVLFILSAAVFAHTLLTNLDHGLWANEVLTLKVADINWSLFESVQWWARFDPHPYAYYLFLRGWLYVTSMHEVTTKLLNPILFVVAAYLSYRIWPKPRNKEYFYFLSLVMSSVWVLFYLIEVRMYGVLVSVTLFAASSVYAIQFHMALDVPDRDRVYRLFNYLVTAVILLIAMDSWGCLFGCGMFICLLVRYQDLRVLVKTNWRLYAALSVLVLILGVQYLNILLLYKAWSLLPDFPKRLSSWDLLWLMLTEFWEQSFVTLRSKIIMVLVALGWGSVLIIGRRSLRDELLLYLGPIVFIYVIVIVANFVTGNAFYKNYVALQLLPFVLLFFVSSIFRSNAKPIFSAAIVGLFVIANMGSIPFIDKFPEKPNHMEDAKAYRDRNMNPK